MVFVLISSAYSRAGSQSASESPDPIVKVGRDITAVTQLMRVSGYQKTDLAMRPSSPSDDIAIWHLGKGYFILHYSIETKMIRRIYYRLIPPEPKRDRTEFSLKVKQFNAETKELTVSLSD